MDVQTGDEPDGDTEGEGRTPRCDVAPQRERGEERGKERVPLPLRTKRRAMSQVPAIPAATVTVRTPKKAITYEEKTL